MHLVAQGLIANLKVLRKRKMGKHKWLGQKISRFSCASTIKQKNLLSRPAELEYVPAMHRLQLVSPIKRLFFSTLVNPNSLFSLHLAEYQGSTEAYNFLGVKPCLLSAKLRILLFHLLSPSLKSSSSFSAPQNTEPCEIEYNLKHQPKCRFQQGSPDRKRHLQTNSIR